MAENFGAPIVDVFTVGDLLSLMSKVKCGQHQKRIDGVW